MSHCMRRMKASTARGIFQLPNYKAFRSSFVSRLSVSLAPSRQSALGNCSCFWLFATLRISDPGDNLSRFSPSISPQVHAG
ncbi:hypothetical protein HDV57DRAFT_494448 [Trichoderma longibrachiatum]